MARAAAAPLSPSIVRVRLGVPWARSKNPHGTPPGRKGNKNMCFCDFAFAWGPKTDSPDLWAPNRQNVIKHHSCFIDFLNRSGRLLVPVCAPEGSLRPPQRSSKGRPGRPEGSQGPPEAPPRSPDTPRAPSGPCQDPLWAHRGTLLDPRKLMLESLRPFWVPFAIDFGTIYLYTSRLYRAGAAKRQQIFLVCLLVVYDCSFLI